MCGFQAMDFDCLHHVFDCLFVEDIFVLRRTDTYTRNAAECYLRSIKRIRFARAKNLTNNAVCFALEMCASLENIDLSECGKLSDRTVVRITNLFPWLRAFTYPRLSDIAARKLTERCLQLEYLDLSKNLTIITDFAVIQFGATLKQLRHINIIGCLNITDNAVIQLVSSDLKLDFVGLSVCTKITDKSLTEIGKRCTALNTLKIADCEKTTDIGICEAVFGCPGLEVLDLERSCITDKSVLSIAQNLKRIKCLNLKKCRKISDHSIHQLAKGCLQLKNLNCSECLELTDQSLLSLANLSETLESINLHGCCKITDRGVFDLVSNCLKLKAFNLSYCSRLTDKTLEDIARNSKQIRSLEMHGCIYLTETGLSIIASTCFNLETLSLYICILKISNSCLRMICKNLKKLTFLRLKDCPSKKEENEKMACQLRGYLHLRNDWHWCVKTGQRVQETDEMSTWHWMQTLVTFYIVASRKKCLHAACQIYG